MQRIMLIIMVIITLILIAVADAEAVSTTPVSRWHIQKQTAHEIAEKARSLGCAEDDPIIERARQLWWEADEQFNKDREILITVIYNEAWGGCSDRHRELVGAVVLNRVANAYGGGETVYDIVTQPRQYLPAYANTTSSYWKSARQSDETYQECFAVATRVMSGQVECPSNVMYQANFKQGKGTYETHKTYYSTSYFCY